MEIKEKLYEKFGSLSGLALKILNKAKNHNNIHQLCYECGVGYKFVKETLEDFCECSGDKYKFINSEIIDVTDKFNDVNVAKIGSEIDKIVGNFKKHKMDLDHVSATSETLIKRANYIIDNHDIEHCNVLFLGDHDFSSIALAYVLSNMGCNDYTIEVLDIDDDVLDFIATTSNEYNLHIKCLHSDFRVGCPISCKSKYDVIFTDPPYTPIGMSLFLMRAIECAKDKFSSIYLCYKSAELSPAIGYKVQKAMQKLFVYFKEIIGNFNVYKQAEALGYRSDLYVCNILPKAFDDVKNENDYDIYTHGKKSLEASSEIKLDLQAINDFICNNEIENAKLIYIVDKKINTQDFVTLTSYYKQKEMKTINHPQESVYVIDYTYQLKDVLNLRTLIMSSKDIQYGIFTREQTKELYSGKYDVILNMYDLTEYKMQDCILVKFKLRDEIKNSLKSILLYRNSNIKNAFVSVATKLYGITKNEARELFAGCECASYAENFVFELSLYDLAKLKNFVETLKVVEK